MNLLPFKQPDLGEFFLWVLKVKTILINLSLHGKSHINMCPKLKLRNWVCLHQNNFTVTVDGQEVHSSVGKESTCNAGDPGLIPGSGRSPGEGIGSPLQYSWASLVAQLVKNPPATWETWVPSLGWDDPLEKGKATHSSILAWRIPWTV